MPYALERIRVNVDGGVAFATLDSPPLNIITRALFRELEQLAEAIARDPEVRVLVLRSADPEFFIAHYDVESILSFPTDGAPARDTADNRFYAMCERFRTMPKATIAQIEGRIGGGGSELVSAFDMRFGVLGKTVINQMEVPLGILPGGGGTQRLPRLLGRGRALELILGAIDLDAATAERWGYLNRALDARDIGSYVERLARRIASFPATAVALAKEAVDAAEKDLGEGLAEESYRFQQLLRTPEAVANMRRFLALGGQTREGERCIEELCADLARTK